MSLFLQVKKIIKKVNIPLKSSRLYCLVSNNFLVKSQPSHSTKACKSASNDTASLYQFAIMPTSKKRKIYKFQRGGLNEFE